MDPLKLSQALEQAANAIAMNHSNAMGVYRSPQDNDASYALRVLAVTLRTVV
jgi:hypothetical protein